VAGTKGVLSWLSGSSALLADAIHGFSDTFASLLVLVEIWLSKRKSVVFPWGLYKVENFVALVSSSLIYFTGYEIVWYVFKATIHYKPVKKDFTIYAIPVEEDKNILSDHFDDSQRWGDPEQACHRSVPGMVKFLEKA
jgi:divalent metal cation (Fe/Co/Zn/Cd) transporter